MHHPSSLRCTRDARALITITTIAVLITASRVAANQLIPVQNGVGELQIGQGVKSWNPTLVSGNPYIFQQRTESDLRKLGGTSLPSYTQISLNTSSSSQLNESTWDARAKLSAGLVRASAAAAAGVI
jgi:hypothetical protein